jgi:transketolase
MSEVKKIATRVSYGNALVELAKEHDDVYVLDADLAAATQTAIFKKEFPDRHIDCGIAEWQQELQSEEESLKAREQELNNKKR